MNAGLQLRQLFYVYRHDNVSVNPVLIATYQAPYPVPAIQTSSLPGNYQFIHFGELPVNPVSGPGLSLPPGRYFVTSATWLDQNRDGQIQASQEVFGLVEYTRQGNSAFYFYISPAQAPVFNLQARCGMQLDLDLQNCGWTSWDWQAPHSITAVVDWGDGDTNDIVGCTDNHVYSTPGSYTITITYQTPGCGMFSSSQSITIAPPIGIALNNNTCDHFLTEEDLHINGGRPPYRITSVLNGQIIAQWPAQLQPGENTLSLSITDSNNCSYTTTQQLVLQENCCTGTDFTCNNLVRELSFVNARLSDIYGALCGSGSTLSAAAGSRIAINGTLTADMDLNLSGLHFLFGENAVFEIGAHNISLQACTLSYCDKMWQGIVHQDPLAQLKVKDCYIEGAISGVSVRNNAGFEISTSSFVNNVTGIEITNFLKPNNRPITGCRFFYAGYGLPEPYYGSYPLSGISIRNSEILQIGDYQPADRNEFADLLNGIVSYNSNVVVRGNHFERISASHYHSSNKPFYKQAYGTAVFAAADWFRKDPQPYLEVRTNVASVGSRADFELCDRAVYVASQDAQILNNKIENCRAGIRADYNLLNSVKITDNLILNAREGIYTYWNLAGEILIQRNEVHAQEFSVIQSATDKPGLYASQPFAIKSEAALLKDPLRISDNTVFGGRNAIWLSHVWGPAYILKNLVALNPFNRRWFGQFPAIQNTAAAIYLNDSKGPELSENYLSGNSALHNQGIHMQRTAEHQTHCNQMSEFGVGMYFREDCSTDYLALRENKTMLNKINWMLDRVSSNLGRVGPLIGDPCHDNNNLFPSNPIGIHTYNFDLPGGSRNYPDVYFADPDFNPDINLSFTGLGEFRRVPTFCSGPPSISRDCNFAGPESMTGDVSGMDELLYAISDSVNYPYLSEGNDWMNRLKVFEKLHQNTDLLLQAPELQTFYAQHQTSEIGGLYEAKSLLQQLADTSILSDATAYTGYLQEMKNGILSIEDESIFAYNEKWAMTIEEKIMVVAHDSLPEEEVNALRVLAESCPYLEGPGVYRARKLLAYFDPGSFYDDKEICSNLGNSRYGEAPKVADEYAYERSAEDQKTVEAKVRILQNPVSEALNLEFSPGYSEQVALQICDVQGRMLFETGIHQKGRFTLPLPELNSGTYFLRLTGLEEGLKILTFIKY